MKTPSFVHRGARHLWREWIRPLALPLLFVTAAKSALADVNYVPSGSMQPTILCGDVLLVNKIAYDLKVPFTKARLARWGDPARGDIVVCFAPDDGTRLVKRVVGLPGDTLESRRDTLLVNGVPLQYEPMSRDADGPRALEAGERNAAVFTTERLGERSHSVMLLPRVAALRDFGPVRIPAGNYFMMGDNRDNSRDSRYFGTVARREIVGEAKRVVLSADPARWFVPRFARFFSRLE
ncbi:MAG: signal peptidase I [Opitutaceae bacterium]